MNANAVAIYSVTDLQDMALALSESRLFGVMTPQQAFALMLIAQADGLHPATVAREYEIIKDRPAMKSQAALARFQKAGGKIRWIERSDLVCSAEFSHELGGTLVVTWDMARATAAKLAHKDNWKNIPQQMLSARVAAEGVRAVFPACLNGLYLVDEVRDFDDGPAGAFAPDHPPMKLDKSREIKEPPSKKASATKSATDPIQFLEEARIKELVRRASEVGFDEDQIANAIGIDHASVTLAKAKAFFTLVFAEERAYAERMNAPDANQEPPTNAGESTPANKDLF